MIFLLAFLGAFLGVLCAEIVLALWRRRSQKQKEICARAAPKAPDLTQADFDKRRETKDIPRSGRLK